MFLGARKSYSCHLLKKQRGSALFQVPVVTSRTASDSQNVKGAGAALASAACVLKGGGWLTRVARKLFTPGHRGKSSGVRDPSHPGAWAPFI